MSSPQPRGFLTPPPTWKTSRCSPAMPGSEKKPIRSAKHVQVMDARDIKSHLLALQRLYGLLKSDGDGLTNPASNILDNHARIILKYFLDSATHRALKVYSEILAGQVGVLQIPCASHLQQTDNTGKEHFRLHMAREVDQSCRNDLGSDKERNVDRLDFKLWKDQKHIRQRSQVDSIEQSTLNADATGAEFRKKRCRVCQRSTVKQMVTDDDTAKYSDISTYPQHEVNNDSAHVPWNIEQETGSVLCYKTNESKTDKRTQTVSLSNFSGVRSPGFSSDTDVPDITTVCESNSEAIYKCEEADSISKEASEAIEQLESCISDLKIGSDNVQLFGEFSGQHENMDSNDVLYKLTSQSAQSPLNYPSHQVYGVSTEVINQPLAKVQPATSMFCQSNGHFSRGGRICEMRESNDETKMPIHGQNMKTIKDKIESRNWRTIHNDFGPNVWNIGVAADHETSPWPSTFSPVSKMESPYQIRLALKNERNRYRVFQPSKPPNTFGNPNYSEKLQSIDSSRRNITSKWGSHVKRHPPNTSATRQECSHQSDRQHKNGVATRRHSMTASRTPLNQQELEDTTSSLCSSDTKSQQASSFCSVGEDYSFSDQTGSHYITSTTSSESGASPQSHGTMRDYDSCTSKSEDDLYSSTSGDGTPVTSSSSGKSDGFSSYNQQMNRHAGSTYSPMKSTSRKKVPGRTSKSASGVNHKKRSKTWKRLKDRLAVIFHHHHHHHHHHDNHDDHRQGSHWKKINVGTFSKKHEGKLIRSKQVDEAYGERAAEKMGKSLIHDKHQKGYQFHGLVEAFLRHIWQKKSKLRKETSGKLAKNQRGRKKALKKSRWWKLLQHHRRGKFPKKAHVKLGLGKKKM